MTTSQTVKNIIEQVSAIKGMHRSTQLIILDESAVRVHSKRGKTVTNVDIRYFIGDDLYAVSVHTIKTPSLDIETRRVVGVYAEDLANFMPDRVVLNAS